MMNSELQGGQQLQKRSPNKFFFISSWGHKHNSNNSKKNTITSQQVSVVHLAELLQHARLQQAQLLLLKLDAAPKLLERLLLPTFCLLELLLRVGLELCGGFLQPALDGL